MDARGSHALPVAAAGWQQSSGATPIGGFSATYNVPATPAARGPGQTLFYFIGAENTDGQPRHGQPSPSGRAILQPVLTFDPDGWCKTSSTGWCFASWYCCPKNLTVHSPYIQDVQPSDSFFAYFNISTDGATYTVSGTSAQSGKSSTLTCPRQGAWCSRHTLGSRGATPVGSGERRAARDVSR